MPIRAGGMPDGRGMAAASADHARMAGRQIEGRADGEGLNACRRPHPGAIFREDVLPALKMTQAEFARWLAVSRLTVSELLHEKRALSPDLAIRLGKLTGTTPESWLRMQEAVDLWELNRVKAGEYALIERLAA